MALKQRNSLFLIWGIDGSHRQKGDVSYVDLGFPY